MSRVWLMQAKLYSEVAYCDTRFWAMVRECELATEDPLSLRSEYLMAAAERYRYDYQVAKSCLEHVEAAIEAVIEYTFRCCQNPSLPLMWENTSTC